MSAEENLITEQIEKLLNEVVVALSELNGDASTRKYYMARTESNRYVICLEKPNGQQSTDFVIMNKLLSTVVRVPKIFCCDLDISILIQEDIGTNSLSLCVAGSKENREELMRMAIDDLLQYQKIDCAKFKTLFDKRFDEAKVGYELELSKDFFFKKYLAKDFSSDDEAVFERFKKNIITHFVTHQEVICHRDYHGRNIYIKNSEIIHIDFQDARLGPAEYDLCSLLDDSYFRLSDDMKESLKRYYFEKTTKTYTTYQDFERQYAIVAIQRILKAMGSFAYLTIDKKKKGYEKYISNAMENLRPYLESNDSLNEFREMLIMKYYEN